MAEKEPVAELEPQFSSDEASPTPWAEARERLATAEVYWLSTVRPDGRPHVTPIASVWLDDALYFTTGQTERKAKNLAQNTHCVVTTGCNVLEGLDVVVDAAGGSAFVYGTSSGAALVLEAAASGLAITKLALWEPPFILDESRRPPADQVERYEEMIAAGRRGDAVEYFMAKVVGLPPEFVAYARTQPFWASQEALAHTLAYDATIMGDYSLPVERAASVTAPTLVIAGGASFPFVRETAQALTDALPDAQHRTLEGQEHNVAPEALAPVLEEFFAGGDKHRGRVGGEDG
jgi:hypothetical protein